MKTYINPYKKFTGIFIPDWLLESDCCSLNAKLVYALLCKFAGENGHCFPSQKTLSEKLKVSDRSIRNYLDELVENGLIDVKRMGLKKTNRYYFLDHPDMNNNLGQENFSALDRKEASTQDRKAVSTPIERESEKESQSNNYVQFVDLWNEVNECNKRITDSKRTQIRARLNTYTEEELKTAIRNRSEDSWINGDGKKFKTNWDSFWRNDEKPERYLNAEQNNNGVISAGEW